MTRHIATLHVTDSDHALHDVVVVEAVENPIAVTPDVYTVTRFDSNGKRTWRFSGHDASGDAWIFALKMAAFGDFKRDYYESA